VKLFVSPHNDDAPLWGSFTLQRETPLVLTVFDSHLQPARGYPKCDVATRRKEDVDAMTLLGCKIEFSGVSDNEPQASIRECVYAALRLWTPTEVWLPAIEDGGHDQHNLVGEIGLDVFKGAKIHRYLSYTRTRGKSTNGRPVTPTGVMVLKKLQAMACYRTQLEIDALGCWPHFIRDQNEYVLD
jgi:LmbE family N-acetylglucosaminyl deacetylase